MITGKSKLVVFIDFDGTITTREGNDTWEKKDENINALIHNKVNPLKIREGAKNFFNNYTSNKFFNIIPVIVTNNLKVNILKLCKSLKELTLVDILEKIDILERVETGKNKTSRLKVVHIQEYIKQNPVSDDTLYAILDDSIGDYKSMESGIPDPYEKHLFFEATIPLEKNPDNENEKRPDNWSETMDKKWKAFNELLDNPISTKEELLTHIKNKLRLIKNAKETFSKDPVAKIIKHDTDKHVTEIPIFPKADNSVIETYLRNLYTKATPINITSNLKSQLVCTVYAGNSNNTTTKNNNTTIKGIKISGFAKDSYDYKYSIEHHIIENINILSRLNMETPQTSLTPEEQAGFDMLNFIRDPQTSSTRKFIGRDRLDMDHMKNLKVILTINKPNNNTPILESPPKSTSPPPSNSTPPPPSNSITPPSNSITPLPPNLPPSTINSCNKNNPNPNSGCLARIKRRFGWRAGHRRSKHHTHRRVFRKKHTVKRRLL